MIRIIIADDHSIVRHGLQQIIALADDISVVGAAGNGKKLVSLLTERECDVVLMDMTMPGRSGVELIQRLVRLKQAPAILVLSMHDSAQLVSRAIKAGAAGYLTKDCEPEELIDAIRRVARGGRYIAPSLAEDIIFASQVPDDQLPHELLTDREMQVLRQLIAGHSINAIAEDLSLSPKTVSTHKMRLMKKMQIRSNAELVRYGLEHHLMT